MNGAELFGLLRGLALPEGHWAVFGSGPLLVRGVIDDANDLDVICRGPAWEHARSLGNTVTLEDGVEIASLHDGAITFGVSWRYGDFDLDTLIDTAEVIDGIPFVRLEHVVAFKQIADRPKDRDHLRALRMGD